MSGNHRRGDSRIGTAMHTVKVYAPSKESSSRSSKHKCVYYEEATRDCIILRVTCVGPSKALCKNYCEKIVKPHFLKENVLVFDSLLGVGMVMKVSDKTFYVKYEKCDKMRSYFIYEAKRFEGGIIYLEENED